MVSFTQEPVGTIVLICLDDRYCQTANAFEDFSEFEEFCAKTFGTDEVPQDAELVEVVKSAEGNWVDSEGTVYEISDCGDHVKTLVSK